MTATLESVIIRKPEDEVPPGSRLLFFIVKTTVMKRSDPLTCSIFIMKRQIAQKMKQLIQNRDSLVDMKEKNDA